jgi:CDP-glycerol glycerophosphotransferase
LSEYETDRGFYFDFRKTAPGPICANASEVMENLEQHTKLAATFEAKYLAWQKKFNPKDDGGAAARVVKAIWR